MEKKICCKCKEKKVLSEFGRLKSSKDGLMYHCKLCNSKKTKQYRIKHKKTYEDYLNKSKEKISLYQKEYGKTNKEKNLIYKKSYYNNNRNEILLKNKEYHKNNREKIRITKKNYVKNRKNTDILFYIKHILRKRIYNFLKTKGIKKNIKTCEIIGCSPDFLKSYIENLFTDGMCWGLIGKFIHIDHIIPLSSAKTEEEIYKLCHYTNLQPLWAEDNIKKGCKIL